MGVISGKNIVSDNVKIWYDAADPKCYPGTGSSVFDLSPNNNTGTLINVTYNTLNGGSFYNSGTVSSPQISLIAGNSNDVGNNMSMEAWVKFDYLDYTGSSGYLYSIYRKGNPDQSTPNAGIYFAYDNRLNRSSFTYICFGNTAGGFSGGGNNFSGTQYNQTFSTSVWNHIAVTINNNSGSLFINGVKKGVSKTFSNLQVSTASGAANAALVGADGTTKSFFSVASFKLYNRALSDTEISNNYNAVVSRFTPIQTLITPTINTNTLVTNNLQFLFDASDIKSFANTASIVWNDLITGGITASLENGVGWSASNSGGLTFDGTFSRVSIPNNTLTQFATASTWSVSIAFSTGPTQSQAFPSIFGKGNSGAAGSGILLFLTRSGSKDTFVFKASNVNDLFIQKNIGTNNIVTITYDNTFLRLYVNGKYYRVSSAYLQPTVETTSPIYIGFNDTYCNMTAYTFAKWNRNLSSLEVLQNHNAIRNRLFLPTMLNEVNSMYIDRVTTAAGTFETNNYLDTISALDSKNLLVDATWLLVPHSYKSGIIYSQFPNYGSNGDLTYTRSSSATRLNVNGVIETISSSIPTIDYTLGAPCLMLEPQRRNLITYSEQFDNAAWNLTRLNAFGSGSIANYSVAPDGNLTADLIQQQTGITTYGGVSEAFTLNSGVNYVLSTFAKKVDNDYIALIDFFGPSTRRTWFNISNGSIGTLDSGHTASIQSYNNGWYRCIISFTVSATSSAGININHADGNGTLTAPSNSRTLLWGAQLEDNGSGGSVYYPTSYIPTTSVAVTRGASLFQLDNLITKGITGTYSGTWFIDFRNNITTSRDNAVVGTLIRNSASDNTGISLRKGPDNTKKFSIEKCTDGVNFNAVYYTTATASKLAVTWNGTYLNIFENGTKVVSNNPFTYSTMQQFYHTSQDITKNIAQMAFFDSALTDASCISLTS